MSYLIPVVLLTWVLVIFALFYYHDKNIIAGAAYETAVVGSEEYRENKLVEEERLEQYFRQRIGEKLIFFPYAVIEIENKDGRILVTGTARARGLKVVVKESAVAVFPEKKLRKLEMIKDGLEDINK